MKEYPSIPRTIVEGMNVIGFDKIDGSNVRAEWSQKTGWYKFGTRHRMIDATTDPPFDEIPALVHRYGEPVAAVFKRLKWERAMAFFEFWGVNSEFGQHRPEEHRLTLIDVNLHKKGRMDPESFINLFGEDCEIPGIHFKGPMTWELAEAIREGSWPTEINLREGVVFKQYDCLWNPMMFKIKTDAWIEEAKRRFSDDPKHLRTLL